jgi:hypothetical protein
MNGRCVLAPLGRPALPTVTRRRNNPHGEAPSTIGQGRTMSAELSALAINSGHHAAQSRAFVDERPVWLEARSLRARSAVAVVP